MYLNVVDLTMYVTYQQLTVPVVNLALFRPCVTPIPLKKKKNTLLPPYLHPGVSTSTFTLCLCHVTIRNSQLEG